MTSSPASTLHRADLSSTMATPPLSPVLDLSFTARERRHSLATGQTSPFSLFGGMPTSPTAALFASPPSSLLMSLSPTSASVNSATTARSTVPVSSAVVLPPVHTQVGFAPVGSEASPPTTGTTTAAPAGKTRRRTKTTPTALGSPGEPPSFHMSQVSFSGGKFW
ncbi:hypothetical protein AMAG_04596 [Allomyces macrogynus ATCC 38327]|uniref:Uncharacterized protein n=1 Tax=Allomyces macrogynus (strain ATCC 38327) TaxID=578462 RepID=A0A0L0S5C4_ALLM3|nr:hypothetical protein AMAG_04596 [Allomyces macrogynus ATCC 38327]|eukprot:KNE57738.1 hypothetical protein AMAG_04596 [Allomyces macrogynus ATCC 38327]